MDRFLALYTESLYTESMDPGKLLDETQPEGSDCIQKIKLNTVI